MPGSLRVPKTSETRFNDQEHGSLADSIIATQLRQVGRHEFMKPPEPGVGDSALRPKLDKQKATATPPHAHPHAALPPALGAGSWGQAPAKKDVALPGLSRGVSSPALVAPCSSDWAAQHRDMQACLTAGNKPYRTQI